MSHVEQPMPTPNEHPPIHDQVAADLQQRKELGTQRYGTPLQPFNGRDGLRDAYEEVLDLAVYLRQVIEERQLTEGRPAGDGPGWERASITELIAWLRSGRPIGPFGAGGYADQVEALLADRDHADKAWVAGYQLVWKHMKERGEVCAALQQCRDAEGQALDQLGHIARAVASIPEADSIASVPEKVRASLEATTRRANAARAELELLRPDVAAYHRILDELGKAFDDGPEGSLEAVWRLKRERDAARDALDEIGQEVVYIPATGNDHPGLVASAVRATVTAFRQKLAESREEVKAKERRIADILRRLEEAREEADRLRAPAADWLDWAAGAIAAPGYTTTGHRIAEVAAQVRAGTLTPPGRRLCCDMHGSHCEPGELCCEGCTEAQHPDHPAGEPCAAGGAPSRVELVVWWGGPDPDNAAGRETRDDEADARDFLQWIDLGQGGGVARRRWTAGLWQILERAAASAQSNTSDPPETGETEINEESDDGFSVHNCERPADHDPRPRRCRCGATTTREGTR